MNPISVSGRRPAWLKVKAYNGKNYGKITGLLWKNGLHTVCQESRCPNIFECYEKGSATFLILGDRCSRNCSFCSVKSGRPLPVSPSEPEKVAEAIFRMGLKHVVITSVTRDDLADGGASVFAETVRRVRNKSENCSVELLIPDFRGDRAALDTVFSSGPDIIAHNLETVERLYPPVRPRADYKRSLDVVKAVKDAGITAKTGIMVGLGESLPETFELMSDAKTRGADIFTVGQYLSPTSKHFPALKYYTPAEFAYLRKAAYDLGFRRVVSGPLVRSSYLYQPD